MKKILVYGLGSHLGGIETFIYTLITHLDFNKFEISILKCSTEKACFEDELKEIGVHFYIVTSRRENVIKNMEELDNLFKGHKFDVFHCNLNSLSYIEPVLQANKNGVYTVIHSHNSEFAGKLYIKVLNKINQNRLPKKNVRLIACSEEAGTWMFRNRPYEVVYNGIDLNRYAFSKTKRNFTRKQLNISENTTVIIHVGAFRKQKNHSYILRIFKEYHRKIPNSVLLLVGEGKLKEMIVAQAKEFFLADSVIFLGNRSDVENLLCASDYFIFPSLYEGFPIALIEAEATGIQCYTSNTISKSACCDELCVSLDIGKDPKDWANEIENNTIIFERENGVEYIKNLGYGINEEVKKIEEIYCI